MIQSESILHLLLTLQCIGEAFILIANKENYVDYLMNANVGHSTMQINILLNSIQINDVSVSLCSTYLEQFNKPEIS